MPRCRARRGRWPLPQDLGLTCSQPETDQLIRRRRLRPRQRFGVTERVAVRLDQERAAAVQEIALVLGEVTVAAAQGDTQDPSPLRRQGEGDLVLDAHRPVDLVATIKSHVSAMLATLQLDNRVQLALMVQDARRG